MVPYKKALLQAFAKSQVQKYSELLSLTGIGDMKPTPLLRKLQSLNTDANTLLRAHFLALLPADVRAVLAGREIDDLSNLARQQTGSWKPSRVMLWSPRSQGQAPVPHLVRQGRLRLHQRGNLSMCAPTTSGMAPKIGPAFHGACFTSKEWIGAPLHEHRRRETPKLAARSGHSGRREQGPINSSGVGLLHGLILPGRHRGQCLIFPGFPHRQKDSSEDRSQWFDYQLLRTVHHSSSARRKTST